MGVDLLMGERHELPHRERVVDRHEADEAVLQLRPLGLPRRTGQDRHPLVDLERVGGDRDRVPV
jgi:hypothetical protein